MCFAEFKIVPRVPYVPTSSQTLVTPVRELEPTPGKNSKILTKDYSHVESLLKLDPPPWAKITNKFDHGRRQRKWPDSEAFLYWRLYTPILPKINLVPIMFSFISR